jgi:hypothetical protein
VLHHGGVASDLSAGAAEVFVVHDAVMRVIGFTQVHQDLLEVCPAKRSAVEAWDIGRFVFVSRLQRLLQQEALESVKILTHSKRTITDAFQKLFGMRQYFCFSTSHASNVNWLRQVRASPPAPPPAGAAAV